MPLRTAFFGFAVVALNGPYAGGVAASPRPGGEMGATSRSSIQISASVAPRLAIHATPAQLEAGTSHGTLLCIRSNLPRSAFTLKTLPDETHVEWQTDLSVGAKPESLHARAGGSNGAGQHLPNAVVVAAQVPKACVASTAASDGILFAVRTTRQWIASHQVLTLIVAPQ
jgi:hypothetical protein